MIGSTTVFQKDGSQWNGCQDTDDNVQQEDPLRYHAVTNQEGNEPTEGYKRKTPEARRNCLRLVGWSFISRKAAVHTGTLRTWTRIVAHARTYYSDSGHLKA